VRKSVTAVQMLAPPTFEREFRITGGHWHHTELALDQFFMSARCRHRAVSIACEGLYLCGSWLSPGGV